MKILILSDIHRSYNTAVNILYDNSDSDVIIFLGDGERYFEVAMAECGLDICGSERQLVYQVAGNCDWQSKERAIIYPVISGYRFCVSHGHGNNVKSTVGIRGLAAEAKAKGAVAAFFGHTHKKFDEEINGVRMFNPGAVENGWYGVVTIDGTDISFEHRSVDQD